MVQGPLAHQSALVAPPGRRQSAAHCSRCLWFLQLHLILWQPRHLCRLHGQVVSGLLLTLPQAEADCQSHQLCLLLAHWCLTTDLLRAQARLQEALQLPRPRPAVAFPEDGTLCLLCQ